MTGVHLDRLYRRLEEETGLSPRVVARCHGQVRAMFNWAVRKRMVTANPAPGGRSPRGEAPPARRAVDDATSERCRRLTTPEFAAFIQLAATVGARRGTLVALRWGDIDLERATITFSRAIAESKDGTVEKGTKSDRTYAVRLGPDTKEMLAGHAAGEGACGRGGRRVRQSSFVFSDDGGVGHWSLAWPSHAWQRYSEGRHRPLCDFTTCGIPQQARC